MAQVGPAPQTSCSPSGGIALASMVVGALLYLLGRRTEAAARRGDALPAAGSGG